jgi:hypothetical protein
MSARFDLEDMATFMLADAGDLTDGMRRAFIVALREGAVVAGIGAHAGHLERVSASSILALIRRGLLVHAYGSEGNLGGELSPAMRDKMARWIESSDATSAADGRLGDMKRGRRQIEQEIERKMARSGTPGRSSLTARTRIVIESDGDRDECLWGDFVDANREMPELGNVADRLRQTGRATIGGGAAPLSVVRLA